jgi:hypothetical protein
MNELLSEISTALARGDSGPKLSENLQRLDGIWHSGTIGRGSNILSPEWCVQMSQAVACGASGPSGHTSTTSSDSDVAVEVCTPHV